ncbi:MAG: tyrosine-type recombinase/integrase [Peptostreptococcaceae bacterium]|nr:tyrosine-type recombinase/integrase [Peptostreptococcaceae bacterium]
MKIHNKTNKPKNILSNEQDLLDRIAGIQAELPNFLKDYFLFLKTSVATTTRLAYLQNIKFFLQYLIIDREIEHIKDIPIELIDDFTSQEFNYFIADYCTRYEVERNGEWIIYENNNASLSRKKSALLSMFKYLYRNKQIRHNISDGINPIKLPKKNPDSIKKLEVSETEKLIRIVSSGEGLSKKEFEFWKHTKKRDLLIILFFVIYGLRISELEALNISSFQFEREEYTIFRKRGKESIMPLDKKLKEMLVDYIETERDHLLQKEDEALFLSTQGKRLSKRSIQNLIKKYTSLVMGTTKNNGYSPHKLRATAASSMIEKGFSIYDVQNLLDHDNITTTQLYAAHKKNAKRSIIDKLDWLD